MDNERGAVKIDRLDERNDYCSNRPREIVILSGGKIMATGMIKGIGSHQFQIEKTSLYNSGTIEGYISGNVVTIYISVLKLTAATAWSNIAVIPSGYRPKVSLICALYDDAANAVPFYIGASGGIQSTGGALTASNYSGAVTYIV